MNSGKMRRSTSINLLPLLWLICKTSRYVLDNGIVEIKTQTNQQFSDNMFITFSQCQSFRTKNKQAKKENNTPPPPKIMFNNFIFSCFSFYLVFIIIIIIHYYSNTIHFVISMILWFLTWQGCYFFKQINKTSFKCMLYFWTIYVYLKIVKRWQCIENKVCFFLFAFLKSLIYVVKKIHIHTDPLKKQLKCYIMQARAVVRDITL